MKTAHSKVLNLKTNEFQGSNDYLENSTVYYIYFFKSSIAHSQFYVWEVILQIDLKTTWSKSSLNRKSSNRFTKGKSKPRTRMVQSWRYATVSWEF